MTTEVSFSNPFFDEVGKYAVRFAVPVIFGDSPGRVRDASLQNGTATLLRLGDRYLAITCHHVIEGFRRARAEGRSFFQVAHTEMDPEARLVDANENLDLAVIDVTEWVGKEGQFSTANFVNPGVWPPRPIVEDDVLSFAGFPGVWRDQVDLAHLRFYSLSSGASQVKSVQDRGLVTAIEFEECVTQVNFEKKLGSLGGMSGGPVFVWRTAPILVAELVGFIYEYQESLDLLMVRSAGVVHEDGRIGV